MQASSKAYVMGTWLLLASATAGCLATPTEVAVPPSAGEPTRTTYVELGGTHPPAPNREARHRPSTTVVREFNGSVTARHVDVAGQGASDASAPANENCVSITNINEGGLLLLRVSAEVKRSGNDATSWRLAAHMFTGSGADPYSAENVGTSPLSLEFNYTEYGAVPEDGDGNPTLAVWVFPWDAPVGLADATPVHFMLTTTARDPAAIQFTGTSHHRCA